ncbi:BnaA02g36600D [Brassica napus]|uniref:(rape) hypothetical protein n=1 Tax=Brassica napus TaxID=3708 RepID=A0A078JI30_BRANA|nr:unnamed protein product [Brassica napus]CDY67243.1 BnaA02g36600D [Brassica napus]
MAEARLLDMSRVPFIPACQMSGIHATNNLYQRYGPKGFMEIKILQNDNLYVRVDLPGVPDDGVRHRVDSVRQKVVFFSGEETLSDGDDKKNARVDAKMKDGVLRMIVSRVKVKDHDNKCTHFLPPNTGNLEVTIRMNLCLRCLKRLRTIDFHDIAWDAEFGVLTVRVSPPGSNNTNRE